MTEAAARATSSAASAAGTSSSRAGLIAGLFVGLGLGLGLILAAIFFIIRSRRRMDEKASEESSDQKYGQSPPPWSLEEAKELPSPTPLIDMQGKKLSELPEGQDPLRHELPQDRESLSELDDGSHNRRSII